MVRQTLHGREPLNLWVFDLPKLSRNFHDDMKEWPVFNDIDKSYFTEGKYPARSAFGVNGMAFDARVEVECMASKSPEA
ncbi:RidA family protein [Pandoraea bronchicola]|nr:Rid family hydrolase [Pandoraea bronchicola]